MLLFLIILNLYSHGDKKLSTKPLKENGVTISNPIIIIDEETGFYKSVHAARSTNGKIVILDRGNYQISIYDKNGKKLSSFGKEGNGPGELGNYPGSIIALKDRIVLRNFDRLLLFDYNGKLIKDIRERTFYAQIFETKNGFKLLSYPNRNGKFLEQHYNNEGVVVKEVVNKTFDPEKKNNQFENFVDRYEGEFRKPWGYVLFNDGYVQTFQGSYKFLFNKNHEETLITREFIRIEDTDPQPPISFGSSKVTKEMKQMLESMKAKKLKMTGGYKNDIRGAVGVIGNYLFISTATTGDGTVDMDVISSDLQYYTQVTLTDKDLKSAYISNGKLMMNMENDDIGLYVKIADITIK